MAITNPIEEILGTDTISNGFRTKYNRAIANFIINATDNGTGQISLLKRDGSKIQFTLNSAYLKADTYSADEIDQMVQFIVNRGIFIWTVQDATAGGYDTDMFVEHNGVLYKSTIDNNTVEPGIDLSNPAWVLLSNPAGTSGSTTLSGPADPVAGQGTTDDWYLQETDGAWWKKELVGGVSTWVLKYRPVAGGGDVSGKVDKNADIVPGTHTKVTYDAKGLVTGGEEATTADIADSADKRYVTEAEKAKIAASTGDQDLSPYATIIYTDAQDDAVVAQILDTADVDYNNLRKIQDKFAAIMVLLNGDDVNLDQIKELADAIKADADNITALTSGKVNTTDIYNALDYVLEGKVLDARQGKVLNDLITSLTTVVNGKEPAISPTTEVDFWSGAKTFLNFAATVFASVLPSLAAGTDTPVIAGMTVKVAIENFQAQITAISSKIGGALTGLTTTDKTSLIAAINEVNAKPSGGSGLPSTAGHVEKDVLSLDAGLNPVWAQAPGGGTSSSAKLNMNFYQSII